MTRESCTDLSASSYCCYQNLHRHGLLRDPGLDIAEHHLGLPPVQPDIFYRVVVFTLLSLLPVLQRHFLSILGSSY